MYLLRIPHFFGKQTPCMSLRKKKRLYCCFIDFKKAFDTVERFKLWQKLGMYGIRGKLLNVIRSMYNNMKSCIKTPRMLSHVFENSLGLLQGEVLSPILFSFYVNDLEMEFIRNGNVPLQVQELNLFTLMYADDMVCFAESVHELQLMLNTLHDYASKWDLAINTDKTKIVVFRNGGKIHENEKWHIHTDQVEVVDKFMYLGVLLNYNGNFNVTQKQLASQGRKAMFCLRSKVSQLNLNVETMFSLFDTYVSSILNYGCEVWGNHSARDIEKIHLEFIKNVLCVRKNTNTSMVYFETGRLPLKIVRYFRIFKFWFKLLQSRNCIIRSCYDKMFEECEQKSKNVSNWVSDIKDKLLEIGLGHIWAEQDKICYKSHFLLIKQRIIDNFVQNLIADINSSSRCMLYSNIIDHFSLQYYLVKPIPCIYKKQLSKIRMSSHNLSIESGRHRNILRNNRICEFCRSEIEDEYHFVLICPRYQQLRVKYIKMYYWKKPSMYKFIQLLCVNNVKELCNLGKFLHHAFKLRND